MLPSCDISGALTGIFTVSTEDAELNGVILTCGDWLIKCSEVLNARKPDHIDAGAVFELEENAGCENEPPKKAAQTRRDVRVNHIITLI